MSKGFGGAFYQLKENDECYTPRYGVEPLLEFMPKFRGKTIWCPFDTDESQFVKVFRENGYDVVNSHISDSRDFFEYEPDNWDLIISNPPFHNKRVFFERALSFRKPFALLMTITWLNDATPKRLFGDEMELLMFDKRITFLGKDTKKINFSSAYFCRGFLPRQIICRELKK